MRIEEKDIKPIQHLLEQARDYGARYMHIEQAGTGGSTTPQQLSFFSNKQTAGLYDQEKRLLEGKTGEVLPVQVVQEALARKVELNDIAGSRGDAGKTIVIDATRLQQAERARVEIFQEAITQQLGREGIKPDQKQLKEHLLRDDTAFIVTGGKKEQEVERPVLIRIEQNEHRAFVVGTIGKQLTIEQSIGGPGKTATLETALSADAALSVLKHLQEEKDKGHRFVSFPSTKESLTPADFTGAKTAFAALENATEKTTEREKHVVVSIRVVETELTKMVEPRKEQVVTMGKEQQRSKGMDLSP
jgi:hypothetical protein